MKKTVLLVLLSVTAAVPAYAAVRSEHHFSLTFSAKATGAPTGIKFLTDRYTYKPPPIGKLADRVATTTFVMQPGTRTNPNS